MQANGPTRGRLRRDVATARKMGSIPYMAASIHLAAATPNLLYMEHQGGEKGPFGNVLIKKPLEYHGGFAAIPERLGHGFEFLESELRKIIVA